MMMKKCAGLKATFISLWMVGMGLISGCAITTPSEESQFYLLSSPAIPSQTFDEADIADKVVVVGPIHFPDYLKRVSIISQVNAHQHDIAKLDQWAGSLEDEFEIALIKHLLKMGQGTPFVLSSGVLAQRQNKQIKIDIYRFGTNASQEVMLEASWVWLDVEGVITAAGSFQESVPSASGVKGQVAGMSLLVERLAAQLMVASPDK